MGEIIYYNEFRFLKTILRSFGDITRMPVITAPFLWIESSGRETSYFLTANKTLVSKENFGGRKVRVQVAATYAITGENMLLYHAKVHTKTLASTVVER